jgi:hypothetical protein
LPAAYVGGWITLDKDDNLWVDELGGNLPATAVQVARFDAVDLAGLSPTPSTLMPKLLITSVVGAGRLTFDDVGNLFLTTAGVSLSAGSGFTNYGPIGRYDAKQVQGTGTISEAAALTTTPVVPFGSPNNFPQDSVLTASGLVVSSTDLYRFSKAQIAMSGPQASFPADGHFTIAGVTGFSVAFLAVDPDGNLFLSGRQNRVLKVSAADLAAQTGTASVPLTMTLRAPTANAAATFGSLTIH